MRKINVLQFICPAGLYGAEMWILALAKNLDPGKVNCSLAVTREDENQNIEVFDRFSALGLDAQQIKMKGRFDIKGIFRLVNLIRNQKVDIIHTHGYKSDIFGLIAARITGIKAIATPHGFENAKDLKLQTFIRLGCLALKYFDRVAPLSEELRADMARMKVKSEKVRLIQNGVDLDEIEAERNLSGRVNLKEGTERMIGYVGQIAYRKNLKDLIDAFDLLYREHNNVRLLLVGEGPQRSELINKARSLSSSDQIVFSGYRRDRLQIMKEMDIFSMTSSLEGIPRCMMEAMAIGVPVAAFNIPGVDKLVLHEKTGLLAEFGDVNSLKTCFERILNDKDFGEKLSTNGRRHVIENFSAKRMAEEYKGLYEELIANSS